MSIALLLMIFFSFLMCHMLTPFPHIPPLIFQKKCTRKCKLLCSFHLFNLHLNRLQSNGAWVVHVAGSNNLRHTRLNSESSLGEDESPVTHPVSILKVLELLGTGLEGVDGG